MKTFFGGILKVIWLMAIVPSRVRLDVDIFDPEWSCPTFGGWIFRIFDVCVSFVPVSMELVKNVQTLHLKMRKTRNTRKICFGVEMRGRVTQKQWEGDHIYLFGSLITTFAHIFIRVFGIRNSSSTRSSNHRCCYLCFFAVMFLFVFASYFGRWTFHNEKRTMTCISAEQNQK